MELPTTPEPVIGQMRVQTMREQPLCYVVSGPATMAGLDKEPDPLMPKLQAAQAQAHVGGGPTIIGWFPSGTPDTFPMEVGIPVKLGTQPAGAAQVKVLPPYRCASLLLCGESGAHRGRLRSPEQGYAGCRIAARRRVSGMELLLLERRVAT